MKQKELRYTFELNEKDLFTLYNNKWYFVIIFEGEETAKSYKKWMFGEPLLKKYLFVFDPINYKIGFYNPHIKISQKETNKEENGNKNNYKKILFVIFVIFMIFALSLFHRKIIKKALKEKTNDRQYTELKNLPDQNIY